MYSSETWVGAAVFAAAAAWTTAFSEPLSRTFAEIGAKNASYTFGTAFAKGVFGGWIIALMVWLMPGAHHARIWVIAALAWCLAAGELTHIIAGSVDVMFAIWWGHVSWIAFLNRFATPVLLGNTIGGLVFVALLNHVQVAADEGKPKYESRVEVDLDRPE